MHSETPASTNKYNQNFRNRFCGCEEDYDPHSEKGTMFQCLGLATPAQGGCGEDWWHPECIVGLPRDWFKDSKHNDSSNGVTQTESNGSTAENVANGNGGILPQSLERPANQELDRAVAAEENETEQASEHPVPPGFPKEEDFDHFICYKCVNVFPWIKRYANSPGFLPAISHRDPASAPLESTLGAVGTAAATASIIPSVQSVDTSNLKRKADAIDEDGGESAHKKTKSDDAPAVQAPDTTCKHAALPSSSDQEISIFLKDDFRDHLCRCASCFPLLAAHPQLLEEETIYEPPVSDTSSADGDGTGSVGSRSLLDRGEAALSNMDRVRAIEGVMAYNKLRDNLKGFLKPFAESGQAVGAEDIKKHFEKLRGDDQAIREAQMRSAERRN